MVELTERSNEPRPPRLPWNDRLLWPVVSSILASVILIFGGDLFHQVVAVFDGCDASQKAKIGIAERAMNQNDLFRAVDIAEEVLISAPNCRCAHLLMARAHLRQKQIAEQAGNQTKARSERKLCSREAWAARELVSHSPEVQGLLEACSASH